MATHTNNHQHHHQLTPEQEDELGVAYKKEPSFVNTMLTKNAQALDSFRVYKMPGPNPDITVSVAYKREYARTAQAQRPVDWRSKYREFEQQKQQWEQKERQKRLNLDADRKKAHAEYVLDDEHPLLPQAPQSQGQLIANGRKAKGFSRERDLATRMSVSEKLVQDWVRNKAVPKGKHRTTLNRLLDINLPRAVTRT